MGGDFFGLDALAGAVDREAVPAALYAPAGVVLEVAQHRGAEQVPDRGLILAAQEVLPGELRVEIEIEVLVAEQGAELVEHVLRTELEAGEMRPGVVERRDALAMGRAVLPAAGHVGVVEEQCLGLRAQRAAQDVGVGAAVALVEEMERAEGIAGDSPRGRLVGEADLGGRGGHGFPALLLQIPAVVGHDAEDAGDQQEDRKRRSEELLDIHGRLLRSWGYSRCCTIGVQPCRTDAASSSWPGSSSPC